MEREAPDLPESLAEDLAGDFTVALGSGAFGAGLAATVLAGAALGTVFPATGFLEAGAAVLTATVGEGFFEGCALAAGAGLWDAAFLGAGADLALGAGFFAAGFLTGAAFTTLEGDFPEDFRTGEEVEFFFNGALVKPKSRARKDR
jgi:hypothetical protein